MMEEIVSFFEQSVKRRPDQWLWSYNLWRQEAIYYTYKEFRMGPILVILPVETNQNRQGLAIEEQISVIQLFRRIYPRSFLEFFCSEEVCHECKSEVILLSYKEPKELFIQDDRYTLLYNFSTTRVEKHFLKQCVFHAYNVKQLTAIAKKRGYEGDDIEEILLHAAVEPSYREKCRREALVECLV